MMEQLKGQLNKFDKLKIVGNYINPYLGLSHLEKIKPDIIFMNIEMGQLNGISVAQQIKKKNSNVNFVFVTHQDKYATQAFELNALDYLTYPVTYNRLTTTFKRINPEILHKDPVENRYYISCFGGLSINKKGDNHRLNIRWRTRKTEEVFAYLLINHGKRVRKDHLVDIIWPYIDLERGINQLYSAIYHIRQTLKKLNVRIEIKNSNQYYILHLNDVEIDMNIWERAMNNLPPINEETIFKHIQVIFEYSGDVFRDLDYYWSEKDKDRLREIWLYHVEQVTDFLYEKGKIVQIVNIYHHVQEAYPLGDNSYYMLMRIYAYLNNRHAVKMQYDALVKMLADNYDEEPSMEIQNWYEQWREINSA